MDTAPRGWDREEGSQDGPDEVPGHAAARRGRRDIPGVQACLGWMETRFAVLFTPSCSTGGETEAPRDVRLVQGLSADRGLTRSASAYRPAGPGFCTARGLVSPLLCFSRLRVVTADAREDFCLCVSSSLTHDRRRGAREGFGSLSQPSVVSFGDMHGWAGGQCPGRSQLARGVAQRLAGQLGQGHTESPPDTLRGVVLSTYFQVHCSSLLGRRRDVPMSQQLGEGRGLG